MRRLANESVLLLAVVSAVCVALDLPETWINVVLAIVPLLLALAVRQVTSSPATVVAVATRAATRTAERLADAAVGAGEVPGRVVDRTVREVVDGVGGLVGTVTGMRRPPLRRQEPPL